ncbi:RseA-like anti sigma(E) protein [Orbus hercynius]|uniref:Anti-sigma-E factor RseA n=1 Tax=Orbus hercynius TaxID=593135 RepID=A0A495RKI7_9GAMM|nr:RseA family anti-sigma factor [Orbus hercynius]RKS87841.1 RseA-like anti sigma(E) protein [Orbus hercynius]
MLREQKEQLSSFIDGEQYDVEFVDAVAQDQDLQQCWQRYHIVRDVMQNKLNDGVLTLNIVDKIADAIALDDLYDQAHIAVFEPARQNNLLWIKIKDVVGKLSQVGLAACVTLAIIAGVQYQQDSSNDISVLNTMPVGVSVAPVGGMPSHANNDQSTSEQVDQQQYNKIRLLVQDYELQKRLNVQ